MKSGRINSACGHETMHCAFDCINKFLRLLVAFCSMRVLYAYGNEKVYILNFMFDFMHV